MGRNVVWGGLFLVNAVLVALALDGGRASRSSFPGRAWERVKKTEATGGQDRTKEDMDKGILKSIALEPEPRRRHGAAFSSRYEALPRNAVLVALPLDGGRASRSPFPGRAWERVNVPHFTGEAGGENQNKKGIRCRWDNKFTKLPTSPIPSLICLSPNCPYDTL